MAMVLSVRDSSGNPFLLRGTGGWGKKDWSE